MSSARGANAAGESSVVAHVARAVRWRLPLVALIAVPMFSAASWGLARQPDVYEAVTVVSVAPRPGVDSSSDLLRLSAQRYAAILGSSGALASVAERTGVSAAGLTDQVDVTVPSDTANIRIVVRRSSARQAARIANDLGAAGQRQGAQDRLVLVEVTSAADVPARPASPPRGLITALALLVALACAVAAATLLERLRPRLRSQSDVEAVAAAPVLGVLPRSSTAEGSLLDALDDAKVGAAVRAMRTRFLAQRSAQAFPHDIAVTSTHASTDGTTVSALLGLALAAGGIRTALVDGNPTTRELAERLDLDQAEPPDTTGDEASLGPTRTFLVRGQLVVFSPGLPEDTPDGLMSDLPKLLGDASEVADLVLVDTPPVMDDVGGAAAVTQVDTALLVVTLGSPAGACQLAADQLAELGVPVLGVVIIEQRGHRRRDVGPGGDAPEASDA